jgi:hypothetical protein
MNEKVIPRIVLSNEEFKIAEFWGCETSKRSVEILRKLGKPIDTVIESDQSNHDISVKGECAIDLRLHHTIEKTVENSARFCRGNSLVPLIPDNIIWGLYDYDEGEQIGDCIGVEVKSTRRKEGGEALKLPFKEPQFRDYQKARGNGMFDAFIYVLTATVRGHPNAVDLLGFAREKEIEKTIADGNCNIHNLNLHPMKFLTHKHYKTSKTLRDYT